jgi:hypothetical protein
MNRQFHSKNIPQIGCLTRSVDTMGAEAISGRNKTHISGKTNIFNKV